MRLPVPRPLLLLPQPPPLLLLPLLLHGVEGARRPNSHFGRRSVVYSFLIRSSFFLKLLLCLIISRAVCLNLLCEALHCFTCGYVAWVSRGLLSNIMFAYITLEHEHVHLHELRNFMSVPLPVFVACVLSSIGCLSYHALCLYCFAIGSWLSHYALHKSDLLHLALVLEVSASAVTAAVTLESRIRRGTDPLSSVVGELHDIPVNKNLLM